MVPIHSHIRDHTLECDSPTKASCIQNNTSKSWNPWPCQLLSWCHIKSFYRPEKRCLFSSYNFLPEHPANCRRIHLGREHLVQTHLFIRKGKGVGSLKPAGSRPSKITKQQNLGDPAQRLCLHVDETNAGWFKAQWQAAPRPCNPWRSGFRTPGALCVCTCSHTHTHHIVLDTDKFLLWYNVVVFFLHMSPVWKGWVTPSLVSRLSSTLSHYWQITSLKYPPKIAHFLKTYTAPLHGLHTSPLEWPIRKV